MKTTVLGVDFGKEVGGPFPIFKFKSNDHFFVFLSQIIVEETKTKISWRVKAVYHSVFSFTRYPGQFVVQFKPSLDKYVSIIFSSRRPFIYTEVSDVGNNEQTELG